MANSEITVVADKSNSVIYNPDDVLDLRNGVTEYELISENHVALRIPIKDRFIGNWKDKAPVQIHVANFTKKATVYRLIPQVYDDSTDQWIANSSQSSESMYLASSQSMYLASSQSDYFNVPPYGYRISLNGSYTSGDNKSRTPTAVGFDLDKIHGKKLMIFGTEGQYTVSATQDANPNSSLEIVNDTADYIDVEITNPCKDDKTQDEIHAERRSRRPDLGPQKLSKPLVIWPRKELKFGTHPERYLLIAYETRSELVLPENSVSDTFIEEKYKMNSEEFVVKCQITVEMGDCVWEVLKNAQDNDSTLVKRHSSLAKPVSDTIVRSNIDII